MIGNWKMNPVSWDQGKILVQAIKKSIAKEKKAKLPAIAVCPPGLYLRDVAKMLEGTKISAGAQDVSPFEDTGSETGSVSVRMLKNAGAQHVIIGHSERRRAGETDADVNAKALLCLREGLTAVVCVGEAVRDSDGEYLRLIRDQIAFALDKAEKKHLSEVIIAYEPIWAIGAKEAMTPHDLHQMSLYIRKVLIEIFGADWGPNVAVIYGGAVNPENALGIVRDGAVDGLLVGRDSLNAENFVEIARVTAMA